MKKYKKSDGNTEKGQFGMFRGLEIRLV